MGRSNSKIHDEIGESLWKNDLTEFSSLLYHLSSIDEPLSISSSVCTKLDIPEDWNPPLLHLLCYLNKPQYLSILLQGYPLLNINIQDIFGYTPLMKSIINRKEQIIEILLSKGANTMIKNQYDSGDTALHYACDGGDMRIALLIISNSSNLDTGNDEGMTSLMYAIQKKHLKLVDTLISMGADAFITDNNGVSGLEWAVRVGINRETIEKISKESGEYDQHSKDRRKESYNDTFIDVTERSFIKEQESVEGPGIVTKTIWKGIDFLITDQLTWSKN
jgi:ankyrin repeat protein